MNITFGICTEYEDLGRLMRMITSIEDLHIPNYEIIVVRGESTNLQMGKVMMASYHLSGRGHILQRIHGNWITEKKNYIAFEAHFDNIVMCHDYFMFSPDWYTHYLTYGDDWDVCSNPQLLIDGKRHFTDWVTWDDPFYGRYYSLPYYDITRTRYQYISGAYFLVKRDFMRENPFNESMRPGDPEDVEWSLRIRDKAKIRCNPNAVVKHNKIHRDVGKTINPVSV